MSKKVTRVLSDDTEYFTIWDNFKLHCEELEKMGATGAQLEPLKKAAQAVADAEDQQAIDTDQNPALRNDTMDKLLAPVTCSNGWIIPRPSKIAKRYAAIVMMKVTGGQQPDSEMGVTFSIIAALWALRAWGDGRRSAVMQAVMSPGILAELLPDLETEFLGADTDQLAEEYSELMGLSKKKRESMLIYRETHETIASTLKMKPLKKSTDTLSDSTSQHEEGSD